MTNMKNTKRIATGLAFAATLALSASGRTTFTLDLPRSGRRSAHHAVDRLS